MSETIATAQTETPKPTPEQQIQIEIENRITELKTYVGKTAIPKGKTGPRYFVEAYGGVRTHQEINDGKPVAVKSHVFVVQGDNCRWTPAATQFIAEHDFIETKTTEANNQII